MSAEAACQNLIDEFRSRPTLRAGSLITTVFGDSITPRGGTVWLGSLIRVMAVFGVSERLVRTSVFRLAKDGWLKSDQQGRRSYYSLTEEGRERFEQATHRIYGTPLPPWDGEWCLLLLSNLDTEDKELVRKECGWLGFGPMSANVLAHPARILANLKSAWRASAFPTVSASCAGERSKARALCENSHGAAGVSMVSMRAIMPSRYNSDR